MKRVFILLPVMTLAVIALVLVLTLSYTRAVQAPVISLDMDPTGNTYDDATNTMAIGTIDPCLTAGPTAITHTHQTHLIIQNVEDLVAFQVRLNYIGDQMRPSTFNATPFTDTVLGQPVGFVNLPIDGVSSLHRGVIPATTIPPAPADGTNTPQTALVGAAYVGTQFYPESPDTPAKVPAETPAPNYGAPNGGVLGSLGLQVVGDESGQASLFMNLDDGDPNPPGSRVVVFTGSGTTGIDLFAGDLGDGFHGEGAACVPLAAETPTPTATATETPTPTLTPSATPTESATATPTTTATPTPTATPRTPTPTGTGAGGSATPSPTRTATPTPRQLPATGAVEGGDSSAWALLLLLGAAIAIPGAVYGVSRLRRG